MVEPSACRRTALLVLAASCAPEPRVLAPSPPVAPSGAPPVLVASVPAAHAALPVRACPDYVASMARGREHARRGEHELAVLAFDDAIRARPYDAPARLERGRATSAAGGDAESDFELARFLTSDRELEAQALLETAHAHARASKAAEARLAYAIAAELGNPEAAAALGASSRCTATWSTTDVPGARFVKGWLAALSARNLVGCEEPDPAANTEAEARRDLCRSCLAGGSWDDANPCTGAGPFRIGMGYLHCSTFTTLLQPLGAGRFYMDEAGGEPLRAEGNGYVLDLGKEFEFTWNTGGFTSGEGLLFNGVRWATNTIELDPPECPVDASAEVELVYSSGCQSGPGIALVRPHRRRWFDRNGNGLLEVAEHASPVRVKLAGKTATLEGAGCNERVVLP